MCVPVHPKYLMLCFILGHVQILGLRKLQRKRCCWCCIFGLSDTTVTLTTDRNTNDWPPKCYFGGNAVLRYNNPHGTGSCSSQHPCICKNPTYLKSDRYEMKTSGTCSFEITSKDECIAAAAIFGVLKNEDPENNFLNHQSGPSVVCGISSVHYGDATTQCSEVYPCLCRLEPPPTVYIAGDCEDFGLEHLDATECRS